MFLEKDANTTIELPSQIKFDEAETLSKVGETLQTSMTAISTTNFIVSLIMSSSLNALWGMINGL